MLKLSIQSFEQLWQFDSMSGSLSPACGPSLGPSSWQTCLFVAWFPDHGYPLSFMGIAFGFWQDFEGNTASPARWHCLRALGKSLQRLARWNRWRARHGRSDLQFSDEKKSSASQAHIVYVRKQPRHGVTLKCHVSSLNSCRPRGLVAFLVARKTKVSTMKANWASPWTSERTSFLEFRSQSWTSSVESCHSEFSADHSIRSRNRQSVAQTLSMPEIMDAISPAELGVLDFFGLGLLGCIQAFLIWGETGEIGRREGKPEGNSEAFWNSQFMLNSWSRLQLYSKNFIDLFPYGRGWSSTE